jgi:CHAD domain-containing protein
MARGRRVIAHATTRPDRLLAARLDDECSRLVKAWPDAVCGEAEGLRRVRVSTRRLRTMLVVFADPADHPNVRRTVRDLKTIGRAYGRSRELLMAREDLARAAGAHDWARGDVAATERWLDRQMARADRARRRHLRQVEVEAVADRLAQIVRASAPMKARLSDVLTRRTNEVVQARATCGPVYEPDRLHTLRIAAKKLRYALEVAVAIAGVDATGLVDGLKRLQRRCGRLHDRQVLLAEIRACGASGSARQARTMGVLASDLETDCRRWHGAAMGAAGAIRDSVAGARRLAAILARPLPARSRLPTPARRRRAG